jgi:hypothetical protein
MLAVIWVKPHGYMQSTAAYLPKLHGYIRMLANIRVKPHG